MTDREKLVERDELIAVLDRYFMPKKRQEYAADAILERFAQPPSDRTEAQPSLREAELRLLDRMLYCLEREDHSQNRSDQAGGVGTYTGSRYDQTARNWNAKAKAAEAKLRAALLGGGDK